MVKKTLISWRLRRCRCLMVGALLLAALPAPHAQATEPAVALQALFSPWDDVEGALIGQIKAAALTVQVQAYLLTSRPITQALLAARRRGVAVSVLADAEMASRGAVEQLDLLAQAGVPVWMETRYAAAHNKLLIIDGDSAHPVVVTGSYNFTWSAQARNAENVLIIRGDRELAARYIQNWQRHQREALPFAQWRGNALKSSTPERKTTHAE